MKKYLLYLFIISFLFSCRKEISLDFPPIPEKLVVQGSIEPGFPPYVILTRNQGYFETIDSSTYNNLFISDAEITVFKLDGNETIDSIELSYELIGVIPVFTNLDFTIDWTNFSQEGFRYNLEINWNESLVTSSTTIPHSTPLDSIWIEETEDINDNKYKCEINAKYTDPDSMGNNILIRSKRVEHWNIVDTLTTPPTLSNEKDNSLLLVDCGPDVLINGESFETYFPRPSEQGGFPSGSYRTFKYKKYQDTTTLGQDSILMPEDLVLIKFCQVDLAAMKFWRGVVRNSTSGGNPFAEPMNLSSNINGGLGSWTGYGTRYYLVPILKNTTITEEYYPNIFDIF
ncbi:MAG: DUF4249 family protein [Flavobacteriales bacterium]|nr:DUF4249 family protein [Flavobacteriales bacterium]